MPCSRQHQAQNVSFETTFKSRAASIQNLRQMRRLSAPSPLGAILRSAYSEGGQVRRAQHRGVLNPDAFVCVPPQRQLQLHVRKPSRAANALEHAA